MLIQKCRLWLTWLLLLSLLLLSACGVAGTPANNTTTPRSTATKSVGPLISLTGPVTYVALGASDAVGIGSNQPGSQGYVPLLAEKLPKGSHLVNLGISGVHLHEALTSELPIALSTTPDLMTIWLVANDFVAGVPYNSYIADLNRLLQQLHNQTHARVVMANLPDLSQLPAFANETNTQKAQMRAEIQRWNVGIASASSYYRVTLVDLFSHQSQLTAHPEYISMDGFHPSALGYVQLANIFWQVIHG